MSDLEVITAVTREGVVDLYLEDLAFRTARTLDGLPGTHPRAAASIEDAAVDYAERNRMDSGHVFVEVTTEPLRVDVTVDPGEVLAVVEALA